MSLKKLLGAFLIVVLFALFALGSGEDSTIDQGSGNATSSSAVINQGSANASSETPASSEIDGTLGDYKVIIDSCRIAKDYEKKPVAIVKYIFTNVSNDEAIAFYVAVDAEVYQNGIGLNESYFVEESAKYDSGNQMKAIKKGATLEVEIAYELDDNTTDIEVEVKQLFSFDDTVIKKTFSIK